MVAGLIFGPAMLIGGLVMAAIAAVGWLLDAGRELKDVEAHGHPTAGRPRSRSAPGRVGSSPSTSSWVAWPSC